MNRIIAYYTGTGGTKRAAQAFANAFEEKGEKAELLRIAQNPGGQLTAFPETSFDLLMLLYPVHSLNAPTLLFKWLERCEKANGEKVAVISVSGGGEIFPNKGCRHEVIHLLEQKNFSVVYEDMLVLPPNCLIKTPDAVASALLQLLPHRVEEIVEAILEGKKRRSETKIWDRAFSHWGRSYEQWAKTFGSGFTVSEACTLCGHCVENCPAGNISLDQEGIHFDDRCHACLSCIYGCPEQALAPKTWKSLILKEGYDLENWDHQEMATDLPQLKKQIKGLLWIGVRRYLNNL